MSPYRNCMLCPRRCGVNRDAGQIGYCGESSALRLAFAGIHRGEEPPVTGKGGSGTIFVSGCNLGCAFCQNYRISSGKHGLKEKALGRIVDTEEFAGICLSLQKHGAENINIVTGSHAAPAIAIGIKAARECGLSIPVLWNSSGYEGTETLEILSGFVDVYLPDLKTTDPLIAAKYFNAPNYPEHAAAAILKMMEYKKLQFRSGQSGITSNDTIISGVIVRHLIIPGALDSTREVLLWFSENCRGRALLSLMTQYTPVDIPGSTAEIPHSFVSENDYKEVLSMLNEFGIDDGYCQELITGSQWLPDFTRQNPFSSKLSLPIWSIR